MQPPQCLLSKSEVRRSRQQAQNDIIAGGQRTHSQSAEPAIAQLAHQAEFGWATLGEGEGQSRSCCGWPRVMEWLDWTEDGGVGAPLWMFC